MESFVKDVKNEPYIEVREMALDAAFVVDLDDLAGDSSTDPNALAVPTAAAMAAAGNNSSNNNSSSTVRSAYNPNGTVGRTYNSSSTVRSILGLFGGRKGSLNKKPTTDGDDMSMGARFNADNGPVVLTWKGVSAFSLRGGKKQLLHNLSGMICGGFYAIMGPSGSGKTTLLNVLACRLDPGIRAEGDIRLNGHPYTNHELKWMSAYVMQDDLLNGHLTVEETLNYTAELRLLKGTSAEEIKERVEEVMRDMNISHVRDVIVGTPLRKGISGGERKRLCVAMELITRPALLFLDEPTSGLDSVAALQLCTRLKELADSGRCAVVSTIHQPQSKIFKMFDHLILMTKGRIVYHGLAAKASQFFCMSGFPLPANENPADHFLDVVASDPNELKEKAEADKRDVNLHAGINRPRFLPRETTPWHNQFMVLLRRSLMEQWRKRNILFTMIFQNILIGVLIGTVFLLIGNDHESTTRRQPVLFFCCINQGIFAALLTINSFPSERVLVLRERAAGTYYVSAYFLAKTTAESINSVLPPIVFSIVVYFLVGFQTVGANFIVFMIFMILCSLSATSTALLVSTWCKTTDLSIAVLPLVLEIMRLFGGFFLPPAKLPNYFSWLDALSYIKYTYVGISLNELQGLELTCTEAQKKVQPDGSLKCPIYSGNQTIASLGFDKLTLGDCVGILISFIFITRLLAYVGLRVMKH